MKAVKEVISLEVSLTGDGDFAARFSHGNILVIGRVMLLAIAVGRLNRLNGNA